jgi:hypothetical protein
MSKFEYGIFTDDLDMTQPGARWVTREARVTSREDAEAVGPLGARRLRMHGRTYTWIPLRPQLTPSNVIHYDAMERRIEVGSYALIQWGDFSDLMLCQVIKLTPQKVRVLLVGIDTDTLRSPRNLVVVDTQLVES